ncbi:MAG: GIY-YIG nuclease family protein [Sphingobacteriales bacterium]|nr:GIY-YIG nuclease family protein [Sphingobacteriales bacterium]
MYYVYVIRSEVDGRFYVGISENTEKRLEQHNKGMTFSTKGYRPWKVFFAEKFETRLEARKREVYLKSGVGKEYIKRKWSGSSVE